MKITIVDEDSNLIRTVIEQLDSMEIGQKAIFDPPLPGKTSRIIWDEIWRSGRTWIRDTKFERFFANPMEGETLWIKRLS